MPRTKEQFEEIRNRTKLTILYSALELFARKGFTGTSISDIASAAGVSKGLAYNYFNSKEDLMIAVFKLMEEQIGGMMAEMNKVEDPYEKLKLIINLTFKNIEKDEKFWRLYINFAFRPELHNTASKLFGNFLSEAFKTFEKIFKQIGVSNPAAESKLLGAMLDGISLHYVFDKENYPLHKMRRYLIKRYSRKFMEANSK